MTPSTPTTPPPFRHLPLRSGGKKPGEALVPPVKGGYRGVNKLTKKSPLPFYDKGDNFSFAAMFYHAIHREDP